MLAQSGAPANRESTKHKTQRTPPDVLQFIAFGDQASHLSLQLRNLCTEGADLVRHGAARKTTSTRARALCQRSNVYTATQACTH